MRRQAQEHKEAAANPPADRDSVVRGWFGPRRPVAFLLLAIVISLTLLIQWVKYDQSIPQTVSMNSDSNPTFSFNSTHFPACQRRFNVSLLAMQTKFGEKIGRFFFEYALLHRRIMCNDNGTLEESERKVLIIQPASGTANRVQSLVSGVIFAALTKRAVWIDWRLSVAFNCPFAEIWDLPVVDAIMDEPKYTLWNTWQARRLAALGVKEDESSSFRIHSLSADFWLCGDYKDNIGIDRNTGESLTFVYMATDESLLPVIVKNPIHAKQVREWFGEGVDPFISIFKFMMQPRQSIMEKVEKFRSKHMPNGCDVGMQVRHSGVSVLREGELNEFWQCAAPDLLEASSQSGKAPTVYITSDDVWTIRRAPMWLANATRGLNVSVVNLSGQVEDQFDQVCSDLSSALAEIYLLAGCRTVIGTSWSSFSMLAMLLAQDPQRTKMVTHVEKDEKTGKIVGTGREHECLPMEYPDCKLIKRNGCAQQTFTHLCYMEARHLTAHSCYRREMFEQDSCCHHGYCGPVPMCVHHTGYAWYSDIIFIWRVWYPMRSVIFIPAGLFAASVWIGTLTLPCRICFCNRCGIPKRIYLSISLVFGAICVGIAQVILLRVAHDLIP